MLNVKKKKFGQLHDQSDGQFGQFGRPGQFCRHFGFRGVNIKKLKIMGSVMILRENVKKNVDPKVGMKRGLVRGIFEEV